MEIHDFGRGCLRQIVSPFLHDDRPSTEEITSLIRCLGFAKDVGKATLGKFPLYVGVRCPTSETRSTYRMGNPLYAVLPE